MKKLTSIVLSITLIISTMTVLMMLPASATTVEESVNLLLNGDFGGVMVGDTLKLTYDATDAANEEYTAQCIDGNAYGWRCKNEGTRYGNAKPMYPSTFKFGIDYSNYSGSCLGINVWGQTAMQDVTLERGKTYKVSAKFAVTPVTETMWYGDEGFDMFLDNGVQSVAQPSFPSGKSYNLTKGHSEVEALVNAECNRMNDAFTNFEKVTAPDGTIYTKQSDFTEYSFIFNADDFLADYSSTAVDAEGKFRARFCIYNPLGVYLYVEDASISEVCQITATEGGVVDTDSVDAGTKATIVATPYYGNAFAGWYNSEGQLVSTQATYTGTVTSSLTARFTVKNQITNGDFETVANHADKITEINNYKSYSASNRGTPSIVSTAGLTDSGTEHGNYALKLTPAAASSAGKQKALINIPVTVKKNTNYIWRFSYRFDDAIASYNNSGLHFLYMAVDVPSSNGSIPWGNSANKFKWTYHSQPTGVAETSSQFTNVWSWGGGTSFTAAHVNDNGTSWAKHWSDVFFMLETGEDSAMFAEGQDTCTVYLTLGTVNNLTDFVLIDNMSFTEAVRSANRSTLSAEEGGSASAYLINDNYYCYTSVGRGDGSFTNRDTANMYTPDMYIPATATATAGSGYAFLGWSKDGIVVSEEPSYNLHTIGENITAKFAAPVSAGEGGVLTDNGDGTVTAKPHYGNTFLGWYKGENLISSDTTIATEGLVGVVAKFGAYNKIVDGSFENGSNATYLTGSATSQVMTDTDGNHFVRVTSGKDFTAFSYRFNVEQGKKYLVSYKLRDGMDAEGNKLSTANTIIRRQIRPVNAAGTSYDWAGIKFASQTGYTFGSLINNDVSAADLLPAGGFYLNPVDVAAGSDYLGRYVRSADEWVTYSYILDATTLVNGSTDLFAGGNTAQLGIVLGVFSDNTTAVMDIDDVLVSEITDADIYPTIGANPSDGSGTYTMTAPAATAGLPVSYIAYPSQFYTFDGWYDGSTLVSTDTVYAPSSPIALTPKFSIHYRDVNETGVGNFEGGVDPHYIATTKNDVTAELAAYSATEKALNGYNADLGDTYLKVTTPNNGSHTDISFPVNVTAGEKYVAHFKLFVSSSIASDPTNDEADLPDSSRFDFRVTADAVSWGSPDFVSGDVSVANGKDIYNKTTVANGLFLVWFGQAAQSKYGDSIVDAYAVIEATGTGTIYLTAGLRNGGVYGIDNVTFVNVNDMAPTMVGATMNTDVEDGNEIMYVTNVNVPSYVALNKIATYMAPTTKLAAAYPERVSDFADDLGSDYVGTATLVANNRTGTIDVKGGATFRSGDVYSSFVGAAAVTQTNKYSVRSVISLTDAYGNDLGVSVATQNTNSASKIENGVYTRSIAQVKRLNAKYYIENGYDALAAEMITPVDGKPLYNCDLAQVWEFVKEAAKQAAAN